MGGYIEIHKQLLTCNWIYAAYRERFLQTRFIALASSSYRIVPHDVFSVDKNQSIGKLLNSHDYLQGSLHNISSSDTATSETVKIR